MQEVCDAGWIQTKPTTAETTGTCGYGVYPITVGSGFSELRNDFGNFSWTKAGYKFDDVNGNGAWSNQHRAGDQRRDDQAVERPGQQQHGQRRRHRGGDRGHGQGRGAGQGRLLRVHRAEGRGVRGAGGLRRRLDPDEAATTAETTGTCGYGVYPITVGSGFSELRNDFGNFKLGTKAGYKFDDVNGNGAWADQHRAGDQRRDDQAVERPGRQQHGQRRRHRGGDRGHGQGRGAGQGRLLRVHRAEGRGVRGAGGLRRRLDQTKPTTAGTYRHLRVRGLPDHRRVGVLRAAQRLRQLQAGHEGRLQVRRRPGNGAWATSTEPGINGVTIKLWNDLDNSNTVNAGDTVAATAVTAKGGALDKDGYYAFTGLKAGEYVVQEVCDAGWIQTKPTTAETTGTCGSGVYPITVGSGSPSCADDFGNFKLGTRPATSSTTSTATGPGRPAPSRGSTA